MMKFGKHLRRSIAVLVLAFAAASVHGQKNVVVYGDGDSTALREEKLASKLMVREMKYRVIVPMEYSKSNETARFPVVYLLHGLTGSYSNWTDRTKLLEHSFKHKFIIVTVEGGNGWYTDSVSVPNDKYESYIVKELVPEIDKKFRTIASREKRFIGGLSMGGYGALKFGLKYPEMFSIAAGFSGALGAAEWNEKAAGAVAKTMDAAFGAELGTETRNANDIFKMIREITPEQKAGLPYLYVSCGTEDFLIENNRSFLKLINEKKIAHEYRELPGGHDWTFWNDQVREFLSVIERRMK